MSIKAHHHLFILTLFAPITCSTSFGKFETLVAMPSQASLDVRVVVDGRPLREYRDPETDLDGENLRTRYVEVKAGQKFGLRVKLLQGFDLRSAKFVKSVVQIDNHRNHQQRVVANRRNLHLGPAGGGTILTDYVVHDNWDGQTDWDEDYGEWTKVKWAFGALGYSTISFTSKMKGPSDVP